MKVPFLDLKLQHSPLRAVVLAARTMRDLRRAKEECCRLGYAEDRVLLVQADVTQEQQIKKLVQDTMKAYGRIDGIFVNAAGTGPTAPVVRVPPGSNPKLIALRRAAGETRLQ